MHFQTFPTKVLLVVGGLSCSSEVSAVLAYKMTNVFVNQPYMGSFALFCFALQEDAEQRDEIGLLITKRAPNHRPHGAERSLVL